MQQTSERVTPLIDVFLRPHGMADPEPAIKASSAPQVGRRAGAEAAKIMISLLDSHARHVIATVPPSSNLARKQEADGLLSVCLQHEVDQLDGIFWIYRLSRLKRDRVVKHFDKTQRIQTSGD